MNFLEILKNKLNYDNIELAYQLFNTLGVGANINSKYSKRVHEIERECTDYNLSPYPDRQKILLKVIELTGNPDTPKQRYILAIAYAWSKANYRKDAIKYLNLYLNNELYDKMCKISSPSWNLEEGTKKHLITMYNYLGKAYIGEYEFEKALEVYEYILNKYPDDPIAYIGKCEVLTKQNKLNECKKWLDECKKLSYFKFNKQYDETATENWFYYTINRLLKETNEKINKGYIYKPRKYKNG